MLNLGLCSMNSLGHSSRARGLSVPPPGGFLAHAFAEAANVDEEIAMLQHRLAVVTKISMLERRIAFLKSTCASSSAIPLAHMAPTLVAPALDTSTVPMDAHVEDGGMFD